MLKIFSPRKRKEAKEAVAAEKAAAVTAAAEKAAAAVMAKPLGTPACDEKQSVKR